MNNSNWFWVGLILGVLLIAKTETVKLLLGAALGLTTIGVVGLVIIGLIVLVVGLMYYFYENTPSLAKLMLLTSIASFFVVQGLPQPLPPVPFPINIPFDITPMEMFNMVPLLGIVASVMYTLVMRF